MQGSANLNIMIKAARKAARLLSKDFREIENLQSSAKGTGDFTQRAEAAALRALRQELRDVRKTYGWQARLDMPEPGEDPTRRWIVDPLSGAANYAHGLPHWAVSIALEHKKRVVSAVIYDPVKDELFIAEKGNGAWMNDKRLRVSGRTRLLDGVFATGLTQGALADLPQTLQDLARLVPATAGVRQWGAPALDLAYVAAGRVEGYWERRAALWDLAAGHLIVQEAGGLIESIAGDTAGALEEDSVLCASEPLFSGFARIIRGA